jgi:hypothetical protein
MSTAAGAMAVGFWERSNGGFLAINVVYQRDVQACGLRRMALMSAEHSDRSLERDSYKTRSRHICNCHSAL